MFAPQRPTAINVADDSNAEKDHEEDGRNLMNVAPVHLSIEK